jgi:hypothetical protein
MRYFLFLAVLFSSPAWGVSGALEVKSGSLRLKREDGFKTHFYPGKYGSELTFKDKKAYLTLHRKGIRTDAILTFPAGSQIPENGKISLDGFRTGQTFRIDGDITTLVSRTQNVREREGCTYYRREWVCRGWGYDRYCDWEMYPVDGLREVEYFFQTKKVSLALELSSDNQGKAVFNGTETAKKKIYTYEGACY